jgi:hypothetical protein
MVLIERETDMVASSHVGNDSNCLVGLKSNKRMCSE